jgi:hypothetical protein
VEAQARTTLLAVTHLRPATGTVVMVDGGPLVLATGRTPNIQDIDRPKLVVDPVTDTVVGATFERNLTPPAGDLPNPAL